MITSQILSVAADSRTEVQWDDVPVGHVWKNKSGKGWTGKHIHTGNRVSANTKKNTIQKVQNFHHKYQQHVHIGGVEWAKRTLSGSRK